MLAQRAFQLPNMGYGKYNTGCSKSHAPSLTQYILSHENSRAIKEVYLDRVTLLNCCDTKHDPIDDLLNELP